MNRSEQSRTVLGFACLLLGVGLIVLAAFLSGEHRLPTSLKALSVSAFAVGGGAMTFVVARRLLTSPTVEETPAETARAAKGEGGE